MTRRQEIACQAKNTRVLRSRLGLKTLIAATVAVGGFSSVSFGQRAYGIDVSSWQGSINWTAVANSGKKFAFVRSSRGGSVGTYNPSTTATTGAGRYDDPFVSTNINSATALGMFAGPYHFSRPDIINYTWDYGAGTVTTVHNGVDEANHMIQQAGQYMKPGYIRPVLDLEAGDARTTTDLTNFALAFANRIFEVKGIYPIVYVNSNYAANEVDSRINFLDLWLARWQTNPNTDTGNPGGVSNVYGVWSSTAAHPWDFWQYSSTGTVPGVSGNCDLNVANGGVEQVKDFLVPALWKVDAGGAWTTGTNWNSDPGLPSANDRVIIDRAAGSFVVNLSSGNHSVRSLQCAEQLNMSGGSLSVQQYANFTNLSTISGGQLSSGSMTITGTLSQLGGTVTTGSVSGAGNLAVTGGTFRAASLQNAVVVFGGTGRIELSASGLAVSVVTSLAGSTGQLDIGKEALVVNHAPGGSPFVQLAALVASGRNNGTWDGAGILSSTAALDGRLAVAIAEATDLGSPATFLGTNIDASAVLMRLTVYGDCNFNGNVALDDFSILAANFGLTGQRWTKGDFNYDGEVGLADFSLLAANFGQGAPADLPRGASIPEPGIGLLGLIAVPLLRRRRDR